MRFLMIAVVAVAAIWSGYWWFGSRAIESGFRDWLDGRTDVGWVSNYDSVRTRGFPNRFDTTVEGLELADPANGVAWSAPLFQVLRLSYRPNHVIAVWPGEQTFAIPEGRVTVRTRQARASVVLEPGADMAVDRMTAVFDDIELDSSTGWSAEVTEGRFAAHVSDIEPQAVNLGIEATAVRLAVAGPDGLVSNGGVPDVPADLKLDAELEFDSVWDRHAIETRYPNLTSIRLDLLNVERGDLELKAAGDLTVDIDGLASGTISVRMGNWRDMLSAASAAGWLSEAQLSVLETGVAFLDRLYGKSGTLEVPLTLRRGRISVGPVPLGTFGALRFQ